MTAIPTTTAPLHAIIPLGVLEAVRSVDAPQPDGLPEFHEELATKRLGMSLTVAAQIDRYLALVARGGRVESAEVVAILRLVGRRRDADLVFTDAGRRAARLARRELASPARWTWILMPRFVRNRLGIALSRRVLAKVFRVRLARTAGSLEAVMDEEAAFQATPDGSACKFFGSAIAAVLRSFTSFDGAVVHERCRAHGADRCSWRTTGLP